MTKMEDRPLNQASLRLPVRPWSCWRCLSRSKWTARRLRDSGDRYKASHESLVRMLAEDAPVKSGNVGQRTRDAKLGTHFRDRKPLLYSW